MIAKEHITGIILAGGKSSRMGTDKGMVKVNGKPFIINILNALEPLVGQIIIVSDNKTYEQFGHKRINDVIANAGPLAGLYSGLAQSKTVFNLVLSCDVPMINTQVLSLLLNEANDQTDVVLVESNGKTMPLIALYKKYCASHFYTQLQAKQLGIHKAISKLNVKIVRLKTSLEKYVVNINTPHDLKAIKDEHYN